MMRNLIFALTASVLINAPPAFAQAPAPQPRPEPPAAAQQMSVAFGEVERLTARIVQLDQRLLDLDAYLKRCADRPGCTVPVPVPAGPK